MITSTKILVAMRSRKIHTVCRCMFYIVKWRKRRIENWIKMLFKKKKKNTEFIMISVDFWRYILPRHARQWLSHGYDVLKINEWILRGCKEAKRITERLSYPILTSTGCSWEACVDTWKLPGTLLMRNEVFMRQPRPPFMSVFTVSSIKPTSWRPRSSWMSRPMTSDVWIQFNNY